MRKGPRRRCAANAKATCRIATADYPFLPQRAKAVAGPQDGSGRSGYQTSLAYNRWGWVLPENSDAATTARYNANASQTSHQKRIRARFWYSGDGIGEGKAQVVVVKRAVEEIFEAYQRLSRLPVRLHTGMCRTVWVARRRPGEEIIPRVVYVHTELQLRSGSESA